MQRWRTILYNSSFALNCLLVFLLVFEKGLVVPPWVQTIGRMHPLLLHFPIVLLLLCVGWEIITGFKKSMTAEQIAVGDGLLLLASVTSVISALMGLLLSKEDGYTQEVVAWHKWGGVAISLLALAWYAFRGAVRNSIATLALASVASLIFVVITGHLGADITHGDNFLLAPVSKDQQPAPVLFEDALVFANMVQPILKAKCVSCHNPQKAKGELVMESFAALLKGGKDGALWDSTQPDFGLMMNRIHLPMESKKHMPPLGKPQLTEDEISILYHWIKSRPNDTTKVTALAPNDTLHILATSLFNTIETDDYTFKPADESKIKALKNNYRLVAPLSLGSPALGVQFFGAAQFKSEQLKELLPVKEQIVTLNLNKMGVQDADLATIAQFTNLRKLNLAFTNIKGNGLAALAPLKELKELSLSGTGVTAASLQPLVALPKLTQLFIWSTPAQNENLASVRKQFKNARIETGFTGDTIVIKLNKPIFENEEDVLMEAVPLKLKHYIKGITIRYTTDGTEPDSLASPVYNADYQLDKNITIKARAFKPGWISSDIAERTFYKAGLKIDSIRLVQPPTDAPYKTLSATILTDGQKGDFNYGNGKWIGYHGTPMQAVLYFDTVKTISTVTVSTLINIDGYIMPPLQLEVWAGSDLAHLKLVKKINPVQPEKVTPAYFKGFDINFEPVKEKYIKVVVVPVAKLPSWHRGKGDKGWAFVDEIFLN